MYLIGKTIIITSDNENYIPYINMKLVVTHCSNKGMGYDNSMFPERLCDLETLDGEQVPFSLYEYEFKVLN